MNWKPGWKSHLALARWKSLLRTILAALLLLQAVSCRESRFGHFSETILGDVPKSVGIEVTPDNRHVFYAISRGDHQQVAFDGVPGPEFKGIYVDRSFCLSPDGRRVAYAVATNEPDPEGCSSCGPSGKWRAIVDGEFGPEYDKVFGITFSPDSRQVAYGTLIKNPRGWQDCTVSVDGKEIVGYFESISRYSPVFSPDGKRLAYVARKGEKGLVVVDGVAGAGYDHIGNGFPSFSADGRHIAYVAMISSARKGTVVFDGKEGPRYDYIPEQSLLFSPVGNRFAYGAQNGRAWQVIVDGRPGPAADGVDHIVFSGDGRSVAYTMRKLDRWQIVVNGNPGPIYDGVTAPVFSPDGKQIAYGFLAGQQGKVAVESVDPGGAERRIKHVYEGDFPGGIGRLSFSPGGDHFAFTARKDSRKRVVIDGRPGPESDDVANIRFSPDGQHVAYETTNAGKDSLVLDGRPLPESEGALQRTFCFSADGRHFAYLAARGKANVMVVDGRASSDYAAICTLFPSGDSGFEALAVRGQLFRVKWAP